MKIYSKQNVYDAAIERIRYLFSEFENVVVNVSGGKDSTVCFYLALKVARELNRLPLNVMWIDQEVEWQGTVDCVEAIMTHPDVKPMWLQMPMVITNNASTYERYNYCWRAEDKEKWAHPQHPLSIKENKYGTDRFHELFKAIMNVEFAGKQACYIAGVRTQEAPKRFMSMTGNPKYKYITWGKTLDKKQGHYSFYPIYDWNWQDVWKYIHDNKLPYNRIYTELYRYGAQPYRMRISNLHHETAIQDLMLVQEIEPETWARVSDRIAGANTIKHMKRKAFTCPAELPSMFKDWPEYVGHLIDNVVPDERNAKAARAKLSHGLSLYPHNSIMVSFCKAFINGVLSNDWDWTKLTNFHTNPQIHNYKQ